MQKKNKSLITCFSVYARMEDLNEDSLYFFLKSGLLSRLNFKQKLNSAHAAESTEKRQKICSTFPHQMVILFSLGFGAQ